MYEGVCIHVLHVCIWVFTCMYMHACMFMCVPMCARMHVFFCVYVGVFVRM